MDQSQTKPNDSLREAWKRAIDSDIILATTKNWEEYSHEAQEVIVAEAKERGLWEKVRDAVNQQEETRRKIDLLNSRSSSSTVEKNKTILDLIGTFVGWIVGFLLWKWLGLGFFIAILLLSFSFLGGKWFSKWYCKREKPNQIFIKCIIWSNILTWLLPPLGLLTGTASYIFSDFVKSKKRTAKVLAAIAIILSLINAIWGTVMRLNK